MAFDSQGREIVKNNKAKLVTILAILGVVILLGALGTAGYFFNRYHQSQLQIAALKSNPQTAAHQETIDLVAKVGTIADLPTGEEPTIATVTEPDKLKDQSVFAKAQKGDKVLIYTKAKVAYLYNPSSNKIVQIAPVTIGNDASAKTKSP